MAAIETAGLIHDYGERRALDGVDLSVEPGEIFGLLGPNGGGKTTLFRILTTLMRPTAGRARILGRDCVDEARAVRRSIGVVFQSPSLDGKLTVYENLRHQGHLYGLGGADLARRAHAMLERVQLADRADERVERLSGGLKRRAELAKGMLHEPSVLLLDEPSTGLDPGARRDLWDWLRGVRERDGVTCLLTTHLMEEAERCDRLAILDRGRVVAQGAPEALRDSVGGDVITIAPADPADARGLRDEIGRRLGAQPRLVDGRIRIESASAAVHVESLRGELGGRIAQVTLGRPTLEDVFVHETGHRFWSGEGDGEGAGEGDPEQPAPRGGDR